MIWNNTEIQKLFIRMHQGMNEHLDEQVDGCQVDQLWPIHKSITWYCPGNPIRMIESEIHWRHPSDSWSNRSSSIDLPDFNLLIHIHVLNYQWTTVGSLEMPTSVVISELLSSLAPSHDRDSWTNKEATFETTNTFQNHFSSCSSSMTMRWFDDHWSKSCMYRDSTII